MSNLEMTNITNKVSQRNEMSFSDCFTAIEIKTTQSTHGSDKTSSKFTSVHYTCVTFKHI